MHRFGTRGEARAFVDGFEGALWAGDAVTREEAAAAAVGVSVAEWAVAATGTLVFDASGAAGRLVSTLPETHVALVSTARIVADLATAFKNIGPQRCSYMAAVTGPSRTADIERVLTIGVHGPRRLVIVCVDEGWKA